MNIFHFTGGRSEPVQDFWLCLIILRACAVRQVLISFLRYLTSRSLHFLLVSHFDHLSSEKMFIFDLQAFFTGINCSLTSTIGFSQTREACFSHIFTYYANKNVPTLSCWGSHVVEYLLSLIRPFSNKLFN